MTLSVLARSTTRNTIPPGNPSGWAAGVASWAKTPVARPKISIAARAIKRPIPVVRHIGVLLSRSRRQAATGRNRATPRPRKAPPAGHGGERDRTGTLILARPGTGEQ